MQHEQIKYAIGIDHDALLCKRIGSSSDTTTDLFVVHRQDYLPKIFEVVMVDQCEQAQVIADAFAKLETFSKFGKIYYPSIKRVDVDRKVHPIAIGH